MCPKELGLSWKDATQHFHNCFGTYTWNNGDKYLGEFKDNKKHGFGTYTFADGAKYVGEYKNGLVWNGIVYENGNVIGRWVNGLKQ